MNKPFSSASSPPAPQSSVLFSLDEILRLEDERVLREQQERVSALRSAEERDRAAARASEEKQQQRLRDLERERHATALARREEDARLEGVRLSELERTRHEVEHQARMSLLAQNQAHEQRLLALSQDQGKKRLTRWLMGVLAAGIVFGAIAFYQARQQQQRTEMERHALLQEAQLLREKITQQQQKIAHEVGRHGQRNEALIEKLRADLQRLQARDAFATRGQNSSDAGPGASRPTRPLPGLKPPNPDTKPEKPPEKTCPKGDPMCETL